MSFCVSHFFLAPLRFVCLFFFFTLFFAHEIDSFPGVSLIITGDSIRITVSFDYYYYDFLPPLNFLLLLFSSKVAALLPFLLSSPPPLPFLPSPLLFGILD